MSLSSVFASRKRKQAEEEEEKHAQGATILASNFQVYAKIDEESRKDNHLALSFLLTLNDVRGSVTYEFRGVCSIIGTSADFEAIMEAHKDSRVPRILDTIYHRLYPVVFMLAGMTTSSYPQSIALLTEMVSTEPIQVHQEAEALLTSVQEKPQIAEEPNVDAKPMAAPAEGPKPAIAKVKKPSLSDKDIGNSTVAK
jgi:hypothetical protein